jgi:uncharacterized protein YggE
MGIPKQALLTAAVVAASLAAAGLFSARTGMAADSDRIERTVSVSATGSVTVEPDVAHISAGVVTEAGSAKDAIARNSAVMSKLIDGLKGAGVEARDIQTRHFNVEPRYTQPKDGRAAVIDGYRVINQVRLTVREVKRLGEILDQAIVLGANQVDSIAFNVSDMETLKDEARKQAMENARRRGELYAKAAGGQLGPVLRIAERVADLQQPTFDGRMAMRASVPVEAGMRNLDVEVHVMYALR